jgi:multiple sugar transport system substrate-binding protein/raffinose/stachyose/melibiose transport system substrate-binding protein
MPNSYYWWALYFRKSVLKDAGIEAPKTWDDLISACKTLNGKGIIPITIGTKSPPWPAAAWFDYINMRLNGPEFHINLMLLKEKYDDPRVKAVFMKWKELLDNKCYIENSAALPWQDAVTPLVQGKAAMYLMGGFIIDTYDPAAKGTPAEGDLDFVRFPIIDPKMPIGEDAPTDGQFIAAKAANLDGAKKFLAWLGSKEVQQMASDKLGRLPTRTDVSTEKFTPAQQQGIKLVQSADFVAQFYDRDTTPEMAEVGMNAFSSFFADTSEKNIDALLKTLEENRARLAAEQANQ